MGTKQFYKKATRQSLVKIDIVSEYFPAWAKVILGRGRNNVNKIAYIDLYAGEGCYEDGTKSTPLRILEETIADKELSSALVTLFNDSDSGYIACLRSSIDTLPGITALRHPPRITSHEVGKDVVALVDGLGRIPSLVFLDPWGYKGLSLDLVNTAIARWGCECIFFFNYNRINPALKNNNVRCHMDDLFGKQRADELRIRTACMGATEREQVIVEEMRQALTEAYGKYVLTFCFKNDKGTRTSHYLVFVSKRFLGYHIMKDIMARHSSSQPHGVPSYECNVAIDRRGGWVQLGMDHRIEDLAESLGTEFSGQRLTVWQVYEMHSPGRPYNLSNYKSALKKLEAEDRLIVERPQTRRPTGEGEPTMGDKVYVTFVQGGR